MHEGGGRWVGSNKLVELKKKKEPAPGLANIHSVVLYRQVLDLELKK